MKTSAPIKAQDFAVTKNACKLCTPLGAVLAVAGVEGAMSILHGSQGCATYIRRYLISHFREPLDVASTSFTEHSAVFGGRSQLVSAVENLVAQYHPAMIVVATTCLAETIGEDMASHLRDASARLEALGETSTMLCYVSTASYRGTHREGYQAAVRAITMASVGQKGLGEKQRGSESVMLDAVSANRPDIALFPGMVSPADLRWLKETVNLFTNKGLVMPDYSETLDGGLWAEWHAIPPGGTPRGSIAALGSAQVAVELGSVPGPSAADWLGEVHGVPVEKIGLPIGIKQTDAFLEILAAVSAKAIPGALSAQRQRLADSYVDGHKYLAGVKVMVYGEADMILALAIWLDEIGMVPALVATGAGPGELEARLVAAMPTWKDKGGICLAETDFVRMEAAAREAGIQLILGNSKGYKAAKALNIPQVRVGFPIHDRYGGQRILHLGYEGAARLYDSIINALIEARQDSDDIGYTYF